MNHGLYNKLFQIIKNVCRGKIYYRFLVFLMTNFYKIKKKNHNKVLLCKNQCYHKVTNGDKAVLNNCIIEH